MTCILRSLPAAAAVLLAALALPAGAQNISAVQRGEIETIIKDYLIKNPEVLQEALMELEKRQAVAESQKHKAAVQDHAQALFNSKHQVVLGNAQGDVTMVEFFDYNCGYCKRALADMVELMKGDAKLRVVLKEFPVLGENSVEAARVSIAARMQDPGGKKFLDFHQKLLNSRGQIGRAQALAVAKEAGFDVARMERDMAGPEPKATLEESFKLADALGLGGTPSYVVGQDVVVGAVGAAALREKVNSARCGKATC